MKILSENVNSEFKAQFKASRLQLLSESSGLLVCTVVALSAQNMIAWADAINTLSATIHVLIVTIVTYRLCQEHISDRFNFGTGKLEAFTSFISDLFIGFGGLLILLASVYQLKVPEKPTDNLLYFVILKLVNLIFDGTVFYSQWRACKKTDSKISRTELAGTRNELIFDSSVGLLGVISYLLRDRSFAVYFSPAGGIVLALLFIFKAIRRMKSSYSELVELSLPLEDQYRLFDLVMENRSDIRQIKAVNCKLQKNILYVDLVIAFKAPTPFSEQCELRRSVEQLIRERYPSAVVRLVLDSSAGE